MTILTAEKPYSNAQANAMALTYEDSLDVIETTVRGLWAKYGGVLDDLRADADTIFVEAWQRYDNSQPWATWLRYWVWYSLVDDVRKRAARHTAAPIHNSDTMQYTANTGSGFDLNKIMKELSVDAEVVLHLALDTPKEVAEVAQSRGGTPRNLRSSIRDFLTGIGWTSKRVTESFTEIKELL